MSTCLELQIQNHIATISIRRPEARNALSRTIVDHLDAALEKLAADPQVRVVVIWSEENFAAGADIKEMRDRTPDEAAAFLFSPTYRKLSDLKVPTIAAMEGYALGGGLELALCCDLRLAQAEAKMGLPETGLGIMPGAGGTVRLPRLIGPSRAAKLIFTGEIIDATEAFRIGLVDGVYDKDFSQQVEKLASRLARQSKTALAAAKQAMKYGEKEPNEARAIAEEAKIWCSLFETKDQKEGMSAFLEKRKPSYQE